jgi:hypothetical protein
VNGFFKVAEQAIIAERKSLMIFGACHLVTGSAIKSA